MAWYRTGTIAATKDGKTITGTGTKWADNKQGIGAGQMLLVPGSGSVQIYEIATVKSDTELTLTDAVASDISGSAYAILAFYGNSYPDFARQLAAQLKYYQSQMDGWQEIMTGTGDVTLVAPDGTQLTISSMSELMTRVKGKLDASKNLEDLSDKTAALSNLGALPLSGGTLTGGLTGTTIVAKNGVSAISNGVDMAQQGTHLVWNEESGTGKGSIVVNRGSGTGGFNIRIVNGANTVQHTNFQFTVDGLLYVPNGSFSVGGRVRAFSAVNSTYLEVKVDGAAKGINFFDSDKTLKEDIKDADEVMALDIIRKIRPVAYKFKDINFTYQSPDPVSGEMFNAEGKQAGSSHKYGVIAQEFEELLPEGVITNSDGKKSLDPLEQIGLLLTVCHAQQKIIDSLEARTTELESHMKSTISGNSLAG